MLRRTLFLVGCLVVALTGCARRPLTPVAPWTDIVDDSLYFLATTTDPDSLGLEYTFDWGDGPAFTTRRFESGETAYVSHSFYGGAWHNVRVRARNENGKSSGWSAPLRFRRSNPPVIYDDGVPVRWAVNRQYHASVEVEDPDGDSVSVKFIWDGSDGAWSAFHPSGSVIADSCLWITGGQHTVGVVARDNGNMVTRLESSKTVNVSGMGIIWDTYDEELYCDGSPTLGSLDGEPVLYGLCENVYCITLDGQLRWSVPMETDGYAPSLSADGTRLYLAADENGLVCLDSRTGRLLWSLPSLARNCTPTIGPDGAIYTTTSSALACELHRIRDYGDSAEAEWTLPIGDWGSVDNGVAIGRNSTAYAVGYSATIRHSDLVAVDSDGVKLWEQSLTDVGGSPVIDSRDRILVADLSGNLLCVNPDGSRAWRAHTDGLQVNCTAVGWNDEIIVIDCFDRMKCYDSEGHERWTSDVSIDAYSNTPCVLQDSSIVAVDPNGCIYCVGSDGHTLWEFSAWDSLGDYSRRQKRFDGDDYTSPVIGPNGDLYASLGDALVCIAHGGLKMANTAWPTYNHDAARSGWAGRQQR